MKHNKNKNKNIPPIKNLEDITEDEQIKQIEVTKYITQAFTTLTGNPRLFIPDEMYKTPNRIYKAYKELFECAINHYKLPTTTTHNQDENSDTTSLNTTFNTTYNGIVAHINIPIASVCAHHFLPYFGYAHLFYIPDKKKLGLSKIPRLIRYLAHQPSSQEELTDFIIDKIDEILKSKGIMLIIECIHTCEAIRGVKVNNAITITSAVRGVFKTNSNARLEALSIYEQSKTKLSI